MQQALPNIFLESNQNFKIPISEERKCQNLNLKGVRSFTGIQSQHYSFSFFNWKQIICIDNKKSNSSGLDVHNRLSEGHKLYNIDENQLQHKFERLEQSQKEHIEVYERINTTEKQIINRSFQILNFLRS